MMKSDLEAHEKECLYRLVRCVDLACHERVPFAGLLDHMANDHEREDFVNAEGSIYRSHFIVHEEDFSREIMWISDHLTLDGRHFFRECCRNANGLWFIWVYLLGTYKEAENYIYTIKITSEDKVRFVNGEALKNYAKLQLHFLFRKKNWLTEAKLCHSTCLKKSWPRSGPASSSQIQLPNIFGPILKYTTLLLSLPRNQSKRKVKIVLQPKVIPTKPPRKKSWKRPLQPQATKSPKWSFQLLPNRCPRRPLPEPLPNPRPASQLQLQAKTCEKRLANSHLIIQ